MELWASLQPLAFYALGGQAEIEALPASSKGKRSLELCGPDIPVCVHTKRCRTDLVLRLGKEGVLDGVILPVTMWASAGCPVQNLRPLATRAAR